MTTRQQTSEAIRPSPRKIEPPAFCDSGTNSACDEADGDLDQHSIVIILMELGAKIADHWCDAPETGENCACACRRP